MDPEEALDFDENLEPIEKSPYASGSNTPRINGYPRKKCFQHGRTGRMADRPDDGGGFRGKRIRV